jgi:peroxiredoxin
MAARRQSKLLDTGATAPDFHLESLDGAPVALADLLAGGPILLAFFKITCPICQLTFPYLERLHQSGKIPVYGISQNSVRDTREFNEDFGVTFPTLLDPEDDFLASNAYGISSVPTLFQVARDGTISRVIEGWRKKEMESLGVVFRAGDNVPEWKAG